MNNSPFAIASYNVDKLPDTGKPHRVVDGKLVEVDLPERLKPKDRETYTRSF